MIKFYLEHHWDGGLASLRFGPVQIRTLVSMAIDRVIIGKSCEHSSSSIFDWILPVDSD